LLVPWILGLIIILLLILTVVVDKKIRGNTPIVNFYAQAPDIAANMWMVEEVFDFNRFMQFVLSYATTEDLLVIEGFIACLSPRLWMRLDDYIFDTDLVIDLTADNKRTFLAMLEETGGFSLTIPKVLIADKKDWLLEWDFYSTSCQLSKRIAETEMEKAARNGIFRYSSLASGGAT
jgi:hypothetical protein